MTDQDTPPPGATGDDGAAARRSGGAARRQRKQTLLRLDPAVHDALARWAADELRSASCTAGS
ncbi:hypothetical protein JHN60_14090, partial [Streptomyces sp. MBT51]|nr:hypothetical protein [Streptomyces sp. MBT51]